MALKEQLTVTNRVKGSIKGQLTRIKTVLESDTQFDTVQCESKLEQLSQIRNKIGDIRKSYYELVDKDEELMPIESSIAELEDLCEELEVRFRRLVINFQTKTRDTEKSAKLNINSKLDSINVRLPDIPLPRFSGNYQDWFNFKEQFINLIDSNDNLSDTQKLYYLKSTLSGNALDVVTLDDSYSSLFKALEDRFENTRFIVNSHINEILSVEISNQDFAKGLRIIVDTCLKHIRALKMLGLQLNNLSEVILMNIILRKLDKETKKQYELSLSTKELPKWQDFIDFLQKRCLVLENLHSNSKPKYMPIERSNKVKSLFVKSNSFNNNACVLCRSSNHAIFKCEAFLKQNVKERFSTAKKLNLCLNCLSSGHLVAQCPSHSVCRSCQKRHNSLLHRSLLQTSEAPKQQKTDIIEETDSLVSRNTHLQGEGHKSDTSSKEVESVSSLCSEIYFSEQNKKRALLSTCIVYVKNVDNCYIPCRVLLDNGSEINLMSKHLADLLGIKQTKCRIDVSGINGNITRIKWKLNTFIKNKDGSFERSLQFLIASKITECVPQSDLNVSLTMPDNIQLADPEFGKSRKIDMLIGAELFYEILGTHKFKLSHLLFQESVFGYIVSGTIENNNSHKFCGFIKNSDSLEENIQKFWKLETVQSDSNLISSEDQQCENHFLATYRRDDSGRFIVSMPFKEDPSTLGDSEAIARKRLEQLWNRLQKDAQMKELYCNFMQEYKDLNHMRKVSPEIGEIGCYYLPHHGVFRPDNPTTKLRVVFNASSPSTNGKALNDILLTGPVNEDLYGIIIRFRTFRYVFLADINKMYRQILINPDERKLLRILWKENIDAPVEVYELNTVTYGTSCAPYLATRTIKQLAREEADNFSKAAEVLLNQCYMDDILSGADNLESAKNLQSQLIQLLKSAGMKLHKWKVNHPALLDTHYLENLDDYSFADKETKALGVTWNPSLDVFKFKIQLNPLQKISKRTILSNVARIYDPIGLLGPVITKAKKFIQELWKLKLDWDDSVPDSLATSWIQFIQSLKHLEDIQIPRYILNPDSNKIVVHGFADASSIAFGAAVYIQSCNSSGTSSHLISSKSQLAPLKTVSIPRLELCACLLLSKLTVKVLKALELAIPEVYLYTDSQIALAWIKTSPWKLKTFVGNRVAKIQAHTQDFQWRHVPSSSNPADLISRGLDATELLGNELWFSGPDFIQRNTLQESEDSCLSPEFQEIVQTEMKDILPEPQCPVTMNTYKLSTLVNCCANDFYLFLLSRTNNFRKLIRIFSFVLRFIGNCRNKNKRYGSLTPDENKVSELCLLSLAQQEGFGADFQQLKKNLEVNPSSKLKFLSPFFDHKSNVIRVGGRLENSNLAFDAKHPIVLPKGHIISKLIMLDIHQRNCHVGAQTLLHLTREKFWPIGGRNLARRIIHDCVQCVKHNPKFLDQKMGNLPEERCIPSFPFNTTGVDFCGPFFIKAKFQRKGPLQKIYVAIFICFATRAVHLEIVSDLTADSFISTLKRFIARRGKCANIFTDNARNFVGANNELKRLFNLVSNPDDSLCKYYNSESINWSFIPPRSPHFGGLWEAGVKSFKFHLHRAVGSLKLTYEEFLTVMTQIESILNSRPLYPLSSDPNELQALTPGHFLIGRPLLAIVEPNLTEYSDNALKRWQRVTKITQYVWMRWQRDYLNHLQLKNKWYFTKQNVSPGTMVIVKEDNMPLNSYLLGRIEKVFFGKDNLIRVCLVKTKQGLMKRAITKLAVLPVD